MNQQQDSRDQPFEEIRILGLEPAEDVVEPGRSVFGGESSTEHLPHWTEPPTEILFRKMSRSPALVTDVVVPASKLMSTVPWNLAVTYTSLDGPKSTPMPSTICSPPAPLPQTTAPLLALISTT